MAIVRNENGYTGFIPPGYNGNNNFNDSFADDVSEFQPLSNPYTFIKDYIKDYSNPVDNAIGLPNNLINLNFGKNPFQEIGLNMSFWDGSFSVPDYSGNSVMSIAQQSYNNKPSWSNTGGRDIQDWINEIKNENMKNAVKTDSNNSRNLYKEFTDVLKSLVGTPYKLDSRTLKEIDCSGTIVYTLIKMGYNIPESTSSKEMASGMLDWISVVPGYTIPQSLPGTLNFYDWGKGVEHVNAGVGQGQIVDATQNGWMVSRNSNENQIIPAGIGQVNQTYDPYSNNTKPFSQGIINFDVLESKYRKPLK